ncbi:phosphorylase [Methylobacter sp. S3L5C]|uniref:phosphorylase family protein n=1 Tax=Methylobacter sp. S3L5C TaxID=2839024 RepID=UPI001FABFA41|nr:phosphorylase [Methylobacter sp. S3L5C]UOA07211.1 phosphorylase [Methylobacter sp. S3L5C]
MITGIVVALPEELATLTSKKISKGHCVFIADKLLVAYSGAGPINAHLAAELLIAKGVGRLVSWGCAAALSASLKPGDLILADKLIDAGNSEMAVNADWHGDIKNRLAKFMVVHSGTLAESISIVSSSIDKKQLHSITGAVALDMESTAIAKVASQHVLPFISIRAIVDPVVMNLPLAINYSLNNGGDIVLGKLLLFLLLHPAELPGLIKLGLHFNAAKKSLKLAASLLGTIADY